MKKIWLLVNTRTCLSFCLWSDQDHSSRYYYTGHNVKNALADLNLRWAYISEVTFSDVAPQMTA